MRVAAIGIGNMGAGLVSRLLKGGYPVLVWNRTESKTTPLIESGATAASSMRNAAQHADVIVTSLMDDKSVLEAVSGPLGFAPAMKPGAIHLCTTTISSECADRLGAAHREAGSRFVSGPVVGRPDAAARGELITFLGGDADAIAELHPLCATYAQKIVGMPGAPGTANAMKLCVNYLAVSNIELMGEIYAFGEKVEIDPTIICDFLITVFSAPALKTYASKVKDRDFTAEQGFALSSGLKDVNLILAAANGAGVDFDTAQRAKRKMLAAAEQGMGNLDWSAFTLITRQEAGLGSSTL